MAETPSTAELEAYLDEALPPDRMADVELALRSDSQLAEQLTQINTRRDAGVHSLGAVWRRRRLTCPTREQLGSFALGVLPDDHAGYIRFHLEVVHCRACVASMSDLEQRQIAAEAEEQTTRRKKYFQSTIGRLKPE